jgi:multiple sugar transport system permease protein
VLHLVDPARGVDEAWTGGRGIAAIERLREGRRQAEPAPLGQRAATGAALLAPALILVTAVLVFPVLYGMYESLFESRFGRKGDFAGIDNYRGLFSDPEFWSSTLRSLVFVFGCVLLGSVLALWFASTLYRLSGGLRFLRGLALIPWLLSSIGAAVLFRMLFNTDYGLPNLVLSWFGIDGPSWLGEPALAMLVVILAQIWGDLPLSMLVILGGFLTLDTNQMDAALVDGASGWNRFRFVALPHLAPQVALSAVLLSYHALTSLGILLGLTGGGPGTATQTLSVMLYDIAFRQLDYGSSLALMVVILVFNGVLTLIYLVLSRRYGAAGA